MQTYLSKERIKAIANYLNSVLPKESIKVFRELEEKGVHFSYGEGNYMEHQANKSLFSEYIHNEYKATASPDDLRQYNYLKNMGQWEYIYRDLINPYININYKKEWATVNSTNFMEIHNKLNYFNNISSEAHLHKNINIKEAIFYDGGIDAYLNDNFGEKTVNPELLKETKRLAELFDKSYYGKRGETAYNKYEYAKKMYLITGDVNLLHNILNENL